MNPSPEPSAVADLRELQRFDTPTICNAIELFGIRPPTSGYMGRQIAACFPDLPPMVGYAATATFRSSTPARSGEGDPDIAFGQLASFADLPGPAIVVFEDLDEPPAGATFGDGMCLTYKTFGAVGLITSGAARDLDNVRKLDFPCFSNGTVCGHGHCHIEAISLPVRVGGLTIYPGDLLHGDCNGVTTIPHEVCNAVPYACERFLEYEAAVLDPLDDGNADLARHKKALAEMNRRLDGLRVELRSRIESGLRDGRQN